MSFLKALFRKPIYRLKVTCDNETQVIAEYEQKVNYNDVKDMLEDYMDTCKGAFLVEEVDGKRTKVLWYKRFRKRKDLDSIFADLKKLAEYKKMLAEVLGGESKSAADYLAEAIMSYRALKELAKEVASEVGGTGEDRIDRIFKLIELFNRMGGQQAIQQQQVPQQQPQQVALPLAQQSQSQVSEELRKEADEAVRRAFEKAFFDTSKAIAPCTVGECKDVKEFEEMVEEEGGEND